MKHCALAMCFAALTVSAASAQQKKAVPPPKPADEGPSAQVRLPEDKLPDMLYKMATPETHMRKPI
jgi:hypothetical protein